MIVEVILCRSARALDRTFSYLVPESLQQRILPGSRVIVPFGKRDTRTQAIVWSMDAAACPNGITSYKYVLDIADDHPFLDPFQLELAKWISEMTFSTTMESLKLFLPPGDIAQVRESIVLLKHGDLGPEICNRKEMSISEWFSLPDAIREKLISSGAAHRVYRCSTLPRKYARAYCRLTEAAKQDSSARLSAQQKRVLACLQDGALPSDVLLKTAEVQRTTIRSLLGRGLIEEYDVPHRHEIQQRVSAYAEKPLNEDQRGVMDVLHREMGRGRKKFYLHGVTGSGKTELYLRLVDEILQKGKNALILVPEIGLTPQTVARFKGRFQEDIAILHSGLTNKERFSEWMRVKNGEVRILVGARSAIFAPMENIGLIVIDEEHDGSYISSSPPKYDTREVAEYISDHKGAILLLGSATPSLKMYQKALKGDCVLLTMMTRANGLPLPEIQVVDMAVELQNGNTGIFSEVLYQALRDNLDRGQQSLLFLNRRGYSGFITCRNCGESIRCESCDVSMTYHRAENRLICHYCGRTKPLPVACPVCHSKKIKDFGIGTEQVEAITHQYFPSARIARMDRDTTRERGSHYRLWQKMQSGDIDILIGTQMITKGLDFPGVTLVGILAADLSLKIPDYRASEWTYSMISQVSGRAGRAIDPGRVILQTYQPEHFAIRMAAAAAYDAFYREEMRIRKEFFYPPFTDMLVVLSRHSEQHIAHDHLLNFYDRTINRARQESWQSFILYPNPAPIRKIDGQYRWQFIIKALPEESRSIMYALLEMADAQIRIERNPIAMM